MSRAEAEVLRQMMGAPPVWRVHWMGADWMAHLWDNVALWVALTWITGPYYRLPIGEERAWEGFHAALDPSAETP